MIYELALTGLILFRELDAIPDVLPSIPGRPSGILRLFAGITIVYMLIMVLTPMIYDS